MKRNRGLDLLVLMPLLGFSLLFCQITSAQQVKECRVLEGRAGDSVEDTARIIFEEVYDPNKTPILFIHGLLSNPDTWEPMVSSFKTDPDMLANYQFWYFAYPTGMSTVSSSALLKNQLDTLVQTIESEYGMSMERKVIVVGHSMGGILAKSLISDSGDKLWNTAFNAPVEAFDLNDLQKQFLSDAYRFSPRTYVQKVIFLATPHRGSLLARGLTGKIATKVNSVPREIAELFGAVRDRNHSRLRPEFANFLKKSANSIGSLRTDSPVTKVLADLPIDPNVEFHSISGVRRINGGKGDGIVPLQSTILRQAYCEVGVFSNHRVHKKEKTIQLTSQMIRTDFDSIPRATLLERLRNADLAFFRLQPRGL